MSLLTPPADRSEAPPAVAVKVWTRERAASKRWQAAGFLSVATTRNWMGAFCAAAPAENSTASEATMTATRIFRVSGIVFLSVYGETTWHVARLTKTSTFGP